MSDEEVTSPFQRSKEQVFRRELTFFGKLRSWVVQQLRSTFNRILPSDHIKQMPSTYKYLFGTILLVLIFGSFVTLLVVGFLSQRSQVFLSPLIDSNEADPNCETITVSVTGSFMGTWNGIWQGQDGFLYSNAMFTVTVTALSQTYQEYKDIMTNLYYLLQAVGQKATNQDLGMNLLYWFSYSVVPYASNSAQRFYLLGDPTIVLNTQVVTSTLASESGICNITNIGIFNEGKSTLSATYQFDAYANTTNCQNAIADAQYFNYIPGINADTFQISIDVRSLITAVAVNLNVLNFDQLVEIESFRSTVYFDNATFNTSNYYNPSFPGMIPIPCIVTPARKQCVLQISPYVYGMPVFKHLGNSSVRPEECVCSQLSALRKSLPYDMCNRFQFLVGFLFWPTVNSAPLIDFAKNFDNNLYDLNEAAFNASFYNSYWGETSPYRSEWENPEVRQSSFDFCRVQGYGACKMMMFSVFDNSQTNWAISNYYYQLWTGACQDTFSIPWERWNKFIETPFTPLLQSYQQCQDSPGTAMFNQLGIQIGNLSIATPFCIILILWLVRLYQRFMHVEIPVAYTRDEKDEALDALAVSLLLARDRRLASMSTVGRAKMGSVSAAVGAADAQSATFVDNPMMTPSSTQSIADKPVTPTLVDVSTGTAHVQRTTPAGSISESVNVSAMTVDQRRMLLWDLVAALEADAAFHEDVYELKQEVQRQQDAVLNPSSDKWVDWRNVRTTAGHKLKRAGIAGSKGSEDSSDLRSERSPSVVNMFSAWRTQGKGAKEADDVELTDVHRAASTARMVSSSANSAATARGLIVLNNEGRRGGASTAGSKYLPYADSVLESCAVANDVLLRVVQDVEQVVLEMDRNEGDMAAQQRYWAAVREVGAVLAALSPAVVQQVLPDSDLDAPEAAAATTVALLIRLMTAHASAVLSCSAAKVRTDMAATVAYQLPTQALVTLGELMRRQSQLALSV